MFYIFCIQKNRNLLTPCVFLVKESARNDTHIYSRKNYALIPIVEHSLRSRIPESAGTAEKHGSFRVQVFSLKVFYIKNTSMRALPEKK